jgi:Tol biopolymer transport system component
MEARSRTTIRAKGAGQNAAASRLLLAQALVEGSVPDLQQNRLFKPPAALTAGLLLLSLTCVLSGASSSDQIRSVAISPDGKLVALDFHNGNSSFIYKIAVDTGVATRLTDTKDGEESSPAFSPDGKHIAYAYQPSDHRRSRIIIVNVDGSEPHQWSPSTVSDFSPVFSPDGKTIIFSRSGYKGAESPIAQTHPHAWDFYASNLDGTNLRQLTNENFYMASPASVSPDGKRMVVVTESLYSNRQICIYSLDGSGPPAQSLRPHVPKEADHKNPILNYPNFMPDGKNILFMAASNGKHGYDYDIYRIDLGTKTLERLTNGNGYATNLRVSIDGKTAVFLKWRSDRHATPVKSEPYVLDIESHRLTPLQISGLN